MENQHRKITGYRELTQDEIDLMNKIKAAGQQLGALVGEVQAHVAGQWERANIHVSGKERGRLEEAEAERWASIARTDLQTGLMALTRAVAQPTSF